MRRLSFLLIGLLLLGAPYLYDVYAANPTQSSPTLVPHYNDPSAPYPLTYNTVAASQTAQALTGGGGGAIGDYLQRCNVIPGTTSPGAVTLLDNSTSIVLFAGGASSVPNLVPFSILIEAVSVSGAWKITTGTNVTVVCSGRFT